MNTCNTEYRNVYVQNDAEPVFCYRTGLTVYEESFTDGALMARGWNCAGYPLNVLQNYTSRLHPAHFAEPQAFKLDIDGEYCNMGLEYIGFSSSDEDGHTHAVVTLKCSDKKIIIKVHTLLDGSPVFSRWLEIANEGEHDAAVSSLAIISGGIETMNIPHLTPERQNDSFYRLGYFDDDRWGHEGDFVWHPLHTDVHTFCGRYGRDRYRHPMFILQNRLMGTTMIGQLAHSAGYSFSFDYKAYRDSADTYLAYSLEVDSYKPLIVIRPKETFVTPAIHIGMISGDLDDAVNAMHSHIRRSVLNLPEARNALYVGSGMGPEHDMLVDTTKQYMEQLARAGAELFIIDAGWYSPPHRENQWGKRVGDWYFDPDRYPNGLKEIEQYCRELGMGFGMWMEVERIGSISKAYTEHADWFSIRSCGERSDGFINLADPDALAWCEEQIARVITDYHLDLFRVDYNVSSAEYFHTAKSPDGRRECMSLRQMEGVHTLYNNLKKRFPKVIFENCAGGGGRTDLAHVYNFNHSWVSDWQKAPRSLKITNGMTMALPPDRVDRLVGGMGSHAYASLDFQMRNAMFGHISLNVFGPKDAEMNSQVFEFIRHSTDLYKSFIRPYLPDAKIYHHTPDTLDIEKNCYVILELAADDNSRDTIGYFTLPGFDGREVTVFPRGVDIDRDYRVYFDNTRRSHTRSGADLSENGIKLHIANGFESELITLEVIGE
ncbi:MAG: glycoside hydrolase family 36 protein [Eubacteriales bacterium]|jgi:alpha-galactosidase